MATRLERWTVRVKELEEARDQLKAGEQVLLDGNLLSPDMAEGAFQTDLGSVMTMLEDAKVRLERYQCQISKVVKVSQTQDGVELDSAAQDFMRTHKMGMDAIKAIVKGVKHGKGKVLTPSIKGDDKAGTLPRITARDLNLYLRITAQKEEAGKVSTKSSQSENEGEAGAEISVTAPEDLSWPALKKLAAKLGVTAKKRNEILKEIAELTKPEPEEAPLKPEEEKAGDGTPSPLA
jgi:hypothetical protein